MFYFFWLRHRYVFCCNKALYLNWSKMTRFSYKIEIPWENINYMKSVNGKVQRTKWKIGRKRSAYHMEGYICKGRKPEGLYHRRQTEESRLFCQFRTCTGRGRLLSGRFKTLLRPLRRRTKSITEGPIFPRLSYRIKADCYMKI